MIIDLFIQHLKEKPNNEKVWSLLPRQWLLSRAENIQLLDAIAELDEKEPQNNSRLCEAYDRMHVSAMYQKDVLDIFRKYPKATTLFLRESYDKVDQSQKRIPEIQLTAFALGLEATLEFKIEHFETTLKYVIQKIQLAPKETRFYIEWLYAQRTPETIKIYNSFCFDKPSPSVYESSTDSKSINPVWMTILNHQHGPNLLASIIASDDQALNWINLFKATGYLWHSREKEIEVQNIWKDIGAKIEWLLELGIEHHLEDVEKWWQQSPHTWIPSGIRDDMYYAIEEKLFTGHAYDIPDELRKQSVTDVLHDIDQWIKYSDIRSLTTITPDLCLNKDSRWSELLFSPRINSLPLGQDNSIHVMEHWIDWALSQNVSLEFQACVESSHWHKAALLGYILDTMAQCANISKVNNDTYSQYYESTYSQYQRTENIYALGSHLERAYPELKKVISGLMYKMTSPLISSDSFDMDEAIQIYLDPIIERVFRTEQKLSSYLHALKAIEQADEHFVSRAAELYTRHTEQQILPDINWSELSNCENSQH